MEQHQIKRNGPSLLTLILLYLIYHYRSLSLLPSLPPPPFHYPLPFPTTNTTFSPTLDRQIPPYLHYIFGLAPDFGGKPFSFIHYLCLTSALRLIRPEVIYLHYVYEPTGWWWEAWKREVERFGQERENAGGGAGTRLELKRQRDVTTVFGNPVEHFAHKADVIRLEVLRDLGGIYLDTDVLVIKDFGPELYRQTTVMGMESQPDLLASTPPSGLCNAVILSKPYSSFIVRWIESYKTFDKTKWASHSVSKPWELAQAFPTEITVLNKFAFFWPIWHDDHLRLIHRSTTYSFHSPSPLAPTSATQYTYHLWESFAQERYLKYYDPDRVHNRGAKKGTEREEDGRSDESSFSKEVRRWVSEELRREWREARRKGEV